LKRVLLTGAAGYIGRPAIEKLADRGFDVHAVTRGAPQASDQATWHSADLLDLDASDALMAEIRPSHLMHLAWVTTPGVYWQSPQNEAWLTASAALLRSFSVHGGRRALLTGTCAEYDWTDGFCIEDETPLRGKTPYTQSKLALRDAAYAMAESGELEIAWARVFFSFGPHEQAGRLVPAVIQALKEGGRAAGSDPDLVRDFMHVDDVADAMVAVLDDGFCGDINIASGSPVTLGWLIESIAEKMGAAGKVDFGKYPRSPSDPQEISADTSRLNDVVGWSPSRDIASALDETIAWWRNQPS
jgi:nucleoside-diphosphate-sugar epimerase